MGQATQVQIRLYTENIHPCISYNALSIKGCRGLGLTPADIESPIHPTPISMSSDWGWGEARVPERTHAWPWTVWAWIRTKNLLEVTVLTTTLKTVLFCFHQTSSNNLSIGRLEVVTKQFNSDEGVIYYSFNHSRSMDIRNTAVISVILTP